ncbi:hypothetical protein HU200_045988 [Digitaria exilis]|uniref:Uncharacterized protein n=1 Tax=Digitaria exilis TaxID=1010633 RepID=A0A835EBL8_9POAL|nr:hypothetical protein HU200_045988 [Digitaria exilis]
MTRTLAPPPGGGGGGLPGPTRVAGSPGQSHGGARAGLPALSPAITTAPLASCMAAAIIAVVVPLVLASALLFLLSPSAAAPPPREPVELVIDRHRRPRALARRAPRVGQAGVLQAPHAARRALPRPAASLISPPRRPHPSVQQTLARMDLLQKEDTSWSSFDPLAWEESHKSYIMAWVDAIERAEDGQLRVPPPTWHATYARSAGGGLPGPTRVAERVCPHYRRKLRANPMGGAAPDFQRALSPPARNHHHLRKRGAAMARDGGADAAARPVASCMAATIIAVVVLLVLASALLFLLSPPASAPPPREPVELAIGFAGHERWLDALRAWAKLACFKLRTSRSPWMDYHEIDVRARVRRSHDVPVATRYDVLRSPASVKKAAKETLEMGKETVKHSAESAARATEEALERTTDKVKRKVSLSARRCDGDL